MDASKRLKKIRHKTGLSQEKFAFLLNEKTSRINSIESGKQIKFPYDLAEKILKILPYEHYNFVWITTGSGNPIANKDETSMNYLDNVTDSEFDLVSYCLKTNKELTIMLLKKLQTDEHSVKKFLLEN